MANQLLFVTYDDSSSPEGFSYAMDLATMLSKDIKVLLLQKTGRLLERFGDFMEAAAFAEVGEHGTAMELAAMGENKRESENSAQMFYEKSRGAGITIDVQSSAQDLLKAVRSTLKSEHRIDMVILAPSITGDQTLNAFDLKRLIHTTPGPVVTMARQHAAAQKGAM